MRMTIPGLRARRTVDGLLSGFFHEHRPALFQRAVGELSRFYALPAPRVEWYEYLDWGKSAGRTFENGRIQLVHPENWKRGRKYNSERQWVHAVYHEMGHYVLWADAERKADGFAYRFVRGIGEGGGCARNHPTVRNSSRAQRKRPTRVRPSRPRRRRRR